MINEILQKSIKNLKGVGDKRASALLRLGIKTIGDILWFFPRDYEDRTKIKRISECTHGENACIRATVISPVRCNYIRKNMIIYSAKVTDGLLEMQMTWFNIHFVENSLKQGEEYVFWGKFEQFPKRQMTSPIFEKPNANNQVGKIVPIYPLTAGITQKLISDLAHQALLYVNSSLTEPIPENIRKNAELCEINYALKNIHFPESIEAKDKAKYRFVFEELFVMQLALSMIKKDREEKKAVPIKDEKCVGEFLSSLPFEMTNDQKKALSDISNDMKKSVPMSRLIQGDVGSGKTAVAAGAMFLAVKNGMQTALMAPTEILAAQHFESIGKMFSPFGIKTELLLGSMTKAKKKEAQEKIKGGEAQVIIGTHALVSEGVEYKNLGLVITDEQHRFGVNQRKVLIDKGENPHSLIMTATPIPRSLALILYCDLDVTQIKELPPGRKPIKTIVANEKLRERVWNFVRKTVSEGSQVYIVCPLVEESETLDLKSVTAFSDELKNKIFSDLKTGFVHGKMKQAEKDRVMQDFASGNIDILVATSVIEVGVNVPNASLMIIENAERFGLSQLHQLRGRVGRGQDEAFCILFPKSANEITKKRMEIMGKTNDGFVISEEDLKLRGPGDFFGTSQHGLPPLKIANLYEDIDVLAKTTVYVKEILKNDPNLLNNENSALKDKICELFKNNITFS